MPIRTRKNFFGFIDPITAIGVLFLVITLAVGVVVTKNNKISLNINEKAGTMCGYCNGATCVSCSAGRTDVGECTNSKQCEGGGVPGSVCGNGQCQTGETPQNCPNDCMISGGPYCGDGNCNGKETPGSCDVDCGNEGSACQPSCGGRACGDDGCGDICGSCILPATCSSSGQCTVTCTPSCTGKMCGDNGCGGNCGTCPGGSTCQFNSCIANATTPPQIPPTTPTDPVTTSSTCGGTCQPNEKCVQIGYGYYGCQLNSTPSCTPSCTGKTCGSNGCGGNCGTCAGGYSCQFDNCVINAPTVPQVSTEQTNEDLSRDCFFSGGQWNNTTKTCFNPDIEEVGKEAEQLIASNPIINPPADDYDIESQRNRQDNSGANIVIPPSVTTPKYTSKAECQANVNPNSKAYEACGQYATNSENQNVILQNTQNLLASLSQIPTNYVSYWQNQTGNQEVNFTNFALATYKMITPDFIANPVLERFNLRDEADSYLDIAFNQQTTLDTADLITFDKTSRYVSNYQRINEQTYSSNSPDIVNYLNSFNAGIRDKETLASTIDLGVTMTAEAYALTVAAPLALTSGGVIPGAVSLMGQAQVISTAMQGGNTTTYCILNGLDENCQQQIARTGLSVATIGVSQYANTFGNALGRFSNTVVSGANLAVDSSDAIVAFSDPNTDSLTRAMSLIAVVGDIGGGIADFNQGQLGFGSTDINIIKNDLASFIPSNNLASNINVSNVNIPKDIPLVAIEPVKVAGVDAPTPPKPVADAGNVADLPAAKPAVVPAADIPVVDRITTWVDEKITKPVGDVILGKPNLTNSEIPLSKLNDPQIDDIISKSNRYVEPETANEVNNYFVQNYSQGNPEFRHFTAGLHADVYEFSYKGNDYVVKIPSGPDDVTQIYENSTINGQRLITRQGLINNLAPTTFVRNADGRPIGVQKFIEGNTFYLTTSDAGKATIDLLKSNGLGVIDPKLNIVHSSEGPIIIDQEGFFLIDDALKQIKKHPELEPLYTIWTNGYVSKNTTPPSLLAKVQGQVLNWWDDASHTVTGKKIKLGDGNTVYIDKNIAKGAQADVSKGHITTNTGRTEVAVKKLRTPTGEQADFIRAANEAEIEILNTTTSSVKPKYYGMSGNDTIVLEYIEGVSVEEFLRTATREQKVLIYTKIKEALPILYADTGLPHGDMNLVGRLQSQYTNLILTPDGQIKFIDQIGMTRYDSYISENFIPRAENYADQVTSVQNKELEIVENQIYITKLDIIGGQRIQENLPLVEDAINRFFPGGNKPTEQVGDIYRVISGVETEDMLFITINRFTNQISIHPNPDIDIAEILNDEWTIDVFTKIKQQFGDMQINTVPEIKTKIEDIEVPKSSSNLKITNPSSSLLDTAKGLQKFQRGSVMPGLAILASATVGLGYADQYFDWGITDKAVEIFNNIFGIETTNGTQLDKSITPNSSTSEIEGYGSNNLAKYLVESPEVITPEDIVPPAGLTKTVEGRCQRVDRSNPCDGNRMYEMYLWYKSQPDGWWYTNGEFTPADFLALMLISEAGSGDTEFLNAITAASSSQLWGSSNEHQPYCTTSDCEAGIFNFIGAYMQSASRRYNEIVLNENGNQESVVNVDKTTAENFARNGIDLRKIANDTIYNPVSKTYDNDTPVHWGNFGCGPECEYLGPNWIKDANQLEVQTGTTDRCGLYDMYGTDGVLAVVFTNNQKYNWTSEDSECFK
jgi:hypothetical protein